jgi:DNA-directed RNA polymerase subunit F
MTKEEIIEMAEGAGFFVKENEAYSPSSQEDHELTLHLERFAKLVADHEREACAEICEWSECAGAIRARGQE